MYSSARIGACTVSRGSRRSHMAVSHRRQRLPQPGRRARRRHGRPLDAAERSRISRAERADATLLRGERAAEVRAAIARLPQKQRATLILRVYHELPHEQIADDPGQLGRRGESELLSRAGKLEEAVEFKVMKHLSRDEFVDAIEPSTASADRPAAAPRKVPRMPGGSGRPARRAVDGDRGRGLGAVAALLGSFRRRVADEVRRRAGPGCVGALAARVDSPGGRSRRPSQCCLSRPRSGEPLCMRRPLTRHRSRRRVRWPFKPLKTGARGRSGDRRSVGGGSGGDRGSELGGCRCRWHHRAAG